jgi:hypothetical protein
LVSWDTNLEGSAMNKGRRINAIVATTAAALGMTMSMTTAPASAATRVKGPQPINALLSVDDNTDNQWVDVRFRTDRKVCKFKLTVWGNSKIDVHYPSGRRFTSLDRNDTLNRGEVDFASFALDVDDYARDTWVLLPATITYTHCGRWAETQAKTTGFLVRVDS